LVKFVILFIWLTIGRQYRQYGESFVGFAPLRNERVRGTVMSVELQVRTMLTRRRSLAGLLATTAVFVAGCSSGSSVFSSNPDLFSNAPAAPVAGAPGQAAEATIGTGQVKVGLILPLSAGGNAGLAGQAMRNAAEMALAEFGASNVQLLVKDDAGSADAARAGAQQALDEGAGIILGPLFAQSVSAVGQVTRPRNIPMIAFSTDANVASSGIYLLSFLPESDVQRIVQYASTNGKRSYAALMPDNPYGSVVEAAFRQDVARRSGQIVVLEHYAHDKAAMAGPIKIVAQAATRADALFIPDGGDAVPDVVQMLVGDGLNTKRIQLLGTGLWDDPRIFSAPGLEGAWYAAPDAAGFRAFSTRYRTRYGQDPARTATLAYDAVALVAALVKTQPDPQQRFSQATLTNPSGFTGIDGLFRFRPDGTNERGLAVLRVSPSGPQILAAPPRSFGTSGI
jgi:branched-chain amino acid transport system substrate-binding protein